jgi:hypothetical protein
VEALTLALAIIGTITGVVALTLNIRREWLDRPKLVVSADPLVSPDGTARVIATVENHGRRSVMVRTIGLAWSIEPGQAPGEHRGEIVINDPWERARLDSGGGTKQVVWDATAAPPTPLDVPLRAFAEHGRGRRVWSRPYLYLRNMANMGWRVPSGTPPEYVADLGRVIAAPVEARWKIWKPRHTRTSNAAPTATTIPPEVLKEAQRLAREPREHE